MRGKTQRIAHSLPQCCPLASSSKPKPCCHLANVQRMHVVSVCLHYGNIIWLPQQCPLKNKVQIHHLHVKCFHMVKRLRKSVQFRRYSTKYASFLVVSYLTFTNKPCHLWSYQAKVHQIFRRCSPIISAVNVHKQTMILQLVFQYQCNECKWYQSALITFSQHYLVAMATSLDKLENKLQILHERVKRFQKV